MKKACKSCRILVESGECPVCKSSDFSTSWKGRLVIIDPEKSEVAKKINASIEGNYAIKVR